DRSDAGGRHDHEILVGLELVADGIAGESLGEQRRDGEVVDRVHLARVREQETESKPGPLSVALLPLLPRAHPHARAKLSRSFVQRAPFAEVYRTSGSAGGFVAGAAHERLKFFRPAPAPAPECPSTTNASTCTTSAAMVDVCLRRKLIDDETHRKCKALLDRI